MNVIDLQASGANAELGFAVGNNNVAKLGLNAGLEIRGVATPKASGMHILERAVTRAGCAASLQRIVPTADGLADIDDPFEDRGLAQNRVTMGGQCYPSRTGIPGYGVDTQRKVAYQDDVFL